MQNRIVCIYYYVYARQCDRRIDLNTIYLIFKLLCCVVTQVHRSHRVQLNQILRVQDGKRGGFGLDVRVNNGSGGGVESFVVIVATQVFEKLYHHLINNILQ